MDPQICHFTENLEGLQIIHEARRIDSVTIYGGAPYREAEFLKCTSIYTQDIKNILLITAVKRKLKNIILLRNYTLKRRG